MRILITGAAGFIGGAVARAARDAGHEVLGLVRTKVGGEIFSVAEGTLAQAPWDEIAAFRPEACLHAAWHVVPGAFWTAKENETCREDSLHFLRALWSKMDCAVTAIGTCAEYAPSKEPLVEERSPLRALSIYAQAKQRLHEELRETARDRGQRLAWARIFYPYGPGEPAQKITSALLASALRGEPLVLRQPESIKDFVYIDDVANALLGLLVARADGTVNIASGEGTRMAALAETAVRLVRRGSIEVRPADAPDPLSPMIGDIGELRRLVPGLAITPLEKGLELLRASLEA